MEFEFLRLELQVMAIWHGKKKKSTWNSSSTILYIHLFLFFFFLPNLVLCSSSSSFLPFWIWFFFFFFLLDMVLCSSKFGPLFFFFAFFKFISIKLEFIKLKFHEDKLFYISTRWLFGFSFLRPRFAFNAFQPFFFFGSRTCWLFVRE